MTGGWREAATLKAGDTYNFGYGDEDIVVTILKDQEPWEEPFGRPGFFKFWVSRSDTGAQGWVCFGPGGKV